MSVEVRIGIVGILLAMALCVPLGAEEPQRSAAGIVFRSDRGGEERLDGLYRMELDGSKVKRLVANERDVLHFAVHPSGKRIAYVCDPTDIENFELHLLDLATAKETEIHRGIRYAPVWSRDGSRLAFIHCTSKWRIRLTNPDLVVARPEQSHVGGDGAPSWFPDGKSIVFQSNRTGSLELFVADTTTGEAKPLTSTKEAESVPEVSPDGRWIAYVRAGDVWVMRSDGSGARNLSKNERRDDGIAWAPDSQRLAFVSHRNDKPDLYLATVKTGELSRLTRHDSADHSPAWSPDGTRLLFVSERDGNEEIYSIRADGTAPTRLTDNPGRDRSPAWLPARSR